MPGSSISTFQDANGFLAELKQVGYRSLLVVEPGQFGASITNILLRHLQLCCVAERPGRIACRRIAPDTTRVVLSVRQGVLSCGGLTIGDGQFLTHGPGINVHERTFGAVEWRDMLISSCHFATLSRALTGASLDIPAGIRLWRPPAALLRRLHALHEAATHVTERRPRASHTAQAVHGLEQELIQLLAECLSVATVETASAPVQRSADVVSAFEDLLSAQEQPPPDLPRICRMLGVRERTLRASCHRQLGIGPAHYLRLRRTA